MSGSDGRIPLVAGVLRKDGRLLLCHRRADRDHYPDVWDLPGGHLDDGESDAEALARELREELGIRITHPGGPPRAILHTRDLELNVFIVDRWEGEPANLAANEHDEIRWVDADELDRLRLADTSYSELLRSCLEE